MSRSSTIPKFFINKTVRIYNGISWRLVYIVSWLKGFKFGELSKTRKRIKFKTKASKKKEKKLAKNFSFMSKLIENPKIKNARLFRTGDLRKRIGLLDDYTVTVDYKDITVFLWY